MSKLAEIRLRACKLWPYGSHAILSLVPVERPGLGTMAVDGHWRLYYDPATIADKPVEQSAGVILHEVYHLFLRHHRRAKAVVGDTPDQTLWDRWNNATDYAVNSMLSDQKIPLWDGVLVPERDGFPPLLAAEDYWRRLTDKSNAASEQQQQQQQQPGNDESPSPDSGGGDGEDGDDSDDGGQSSPQASDEDSDNQPGDDQPSDGDGDGQPSDSQASDGDGDGDGETEGDGDANGQPTGTPRGGSCADGRQRPWELPAPSECDTPGMAQHEQEIILHETAKRILDKQCGEASAGLQMWAKDIIEPRIDPAIALLRHVRASVETATGRGDYSYRRPNRRFESSAILMPSAVQPIPRITVVIDTSGSMGQRDLSFAVGLVAKVLNRFTIRDGIQVLTGDTQKATAARAFNARSIKLAGGGGTDMGALIAEASQAKPKPQLIVVATDGWTPWGEPVGIPVVACITGRMPTTDPPEWVPCVMLA